MSSLEEIIAIMKKGFEDIQAQMGRQREEIEGLREEIAHDVSAMRSEVDGRLKMHAKAMYDHTNAHMQARLEEAFKTASDVPPTTTPTPRKDKARVVNLIFLASILPVDSRIRLSPDRHPWPSRSSSRVFIILKIKRLIFMPIILGSSLGGM